MPVMNVHWTRASFAVGLLALPFVVGCSQFYGSDDDDGFSAEEWARIRDIAPLGSGMPSNPFNARANDATLARLGQMLFFETEFSGPIRVDGPSGKAGEAGKVACVSCHDPHRYFVDSRTTEGLSHGVAFTARSAPSLVNLIGYEWITWSGKHDSLCMQGANAPEAPTDVATTRLLYAHVLWRKYRDEYNSAFPATPLDEALDPMHPDAGRFPPAGKPKASANDPDGAWELMAPEDRHLINQIMANVGKATEAYERQLLSRGSAFEQYLNGERQALAPEAKRGLRLFIGRASCIDCHTGPVMSDNRFHNIGVPQKAAQTLQDTGRFGDIPRVVNNPFNGAGEFSDDRDAGMRKLMGLTPPDPITRGQFRTPSLHHVAETAPYMHDGSLRTLEEVVRLYNAGGGEAGTYPGTRDIKLAGPLGLANDEMMDLVAFLKSLTGGPVPEDWARDTAKH
jgi:cytochrome c peroxidase